MKVNKKKNGCDINRYVSLICYLLLLNRVSRTAWNIQI